jgi:ADP-ribose pyrophosphatase YjhB (NUDIX family)
MDSINDYLPEEHVIRTTSRGLVYKDGKFLVMRRTRRLTTGKLHTYLSIPGGTVEPGEIPEQTAQREIYEETSVVVEPKQLAAVIKRDDGCVHNFVWCEYVSGEPHLGPNSEEAAKHSADNYYDPIWMAANEVTDKALHPEYAGLEDVLPKLIKLDGRVDKPIEVTESRTDK